MKIISFNEIIACNDYLKEKNLDFKVHIRDACGRQSFWIEPLSGQEENEYGIMYSALASYFLKLGAVIKYDENKIDFWVEQKAGM